MYRNLVTDIHDEEREWITNIMRNDSLSNENAPDLADKIRSIVSRHRTDLTFRKHLDKELPSFLHHLNSNNVSLNNTKLLLSALSIDLSKTYSIGSARSYKESVEISSLQLVNVFYPHFEWSCDREYINHPFGIIANLMYYQSMLKHLITNSFNQTVSHNTILWDREALQNITDRVLRQYSGTYHIWGDTRRRFHHKFPDRTFDFHTYPFGPNLF
eukprot:3808_1